MRKEIAIAWAAGIVEGEGYISVHNNRVMVVVEMTDKDVLDKLQEYFKGNVYAQKQRKEHWKPSFKWQIGDTRKAQEFLKEIYPFLGARRRAKCDEAFAIISKSERKDQLVARVYELRDQDLTHKAISDILGCDRSYISRILGIRNELLIKL
jgi:hypothetical protein